MITSKFEIDEQIIKCCNCELCNLEINDNSKYYMGYGKLLSRQFSTKSEIMIIGLNPSHVRWQGLIFHFSGYSKIFDKKADKNVGLRFLNIFKYYNVLDKCM